MNEKTTFGSVDILSKYDVAGYVPPEMSIPNFNDMSGIILIVGSSGSGKTTILNSVDATKVHIDNEKSIIDNFTSHHKGERLLIAMGLRTIPAWTRRINEVSNGEAHRARMALSVDQGITVLDEFTSVVDRVTAKTLSVAVRKYIDETSASVMIATCHRDVEEWLCPDYIYDTDLGRFVARRFLRRPKINITIKSANYANWSRFSKHHYLDSSMSKATHCYIAVVDGETIGFSSVIHGCSRDIRTYWRECRTVVLPEWQGLGIGTAMSDNIAKIYVDKGLRYFSKTAHPAMGEHRQRSDAWRATSTNMKSRSSYIRKDGTTRKTSKHGQSDAMKRRDAGRVCYSHEYIGCDLK